MRPFLGRKGTCHNFPEVNRAKWFLPPWVKLRSACYRPWGLCYWGGMPNSPVQPPPTNPPETGVYFTQQPRRNPVARMLVPGSSIPKQKKTHF